MLTEALLTATTVWYIPGWMRTQEPRADVMACVSNAYPNAKVEFKAWGTVDEMKKSFAKVEGQL